MTSSASRTLDAALAKRIKDAVDAAFDDQIAFTRELVSRPSIRPVSMERRAESSPPRETVTTTSDPPPLTTSTSRRSERA